MHIKARSAHIAKWEQSGQSKKAYCEAAGIKYGTFISWFKKEVPLEPGRFRKLEQSEQRYHLEILLPNGIRILSEQKLSLELLKSLQNV